MENDATSRILLDFSQPVPADNIIIMHEPLAIPDRAMEAMEEYWAHQLKEKQTALYDAGIMATIRMDRTLHSLPSLYVNEKPVMWPGTAVTLRNAQINSGLVQLTVSDIPYPFIAALNHAGFERQSGLDALALRPPLAICTFAITNDNMLVLTVRGQTTNVYPGRIYGQGGNPQQASFDIVAHQLEEMADELMVAPFEVDADSFQFYGLVEDLELFPRKPDLVGIVRLRMTAAALLSRFEQRPEQDRPPDVVKVLCIPFNKKTVTHFLQHEKSMADFCPPAYAGLRLLINWQL